MTEEARTEALSQLIYKCAKEAFLELFKNKEHYYNCVLLAPAEGYAPHKNVPSGLPKDLEFYLENYHSIVFFPKAPYSIKIVGLTEFERANKVLIGEEHKEDMSHNWFLIADDSNSQYITIDLSKDRWGYCYDSFWDRYGVVGEQAIIAKSFTELLERIYACKGQQWYWLNSAFISYGDAYDAI